MMRSRSVALCLLAVLALDATHVRGQRSKSETGYYEIEAKKKEEEERKKKEAEQKKQETPASKDPCGDLSKKLEATDKALDNLKKVADAFKTDRDGVTEKIRLVTPTFEKYTKNYNDCVNDPALQKQLTQELGEVRALMLAAVIKPRDALKEIPKSVHEAPGPAKEIAEYNAQADKANIEISELTYTVKNPFACANRFAATLYDTELVGQWLKDVGETLRELSEAMDAVMSAGNGEIAGMLTDEKNATCQQKMEEFYKNKGGKYDELIAKKGDKNKLTRRKKLDEMDPESYLVNSKRVDEKLEKVTIQPGDSLWSIAKGMVEKSKRTNANINKMMHKLIAALKKEKGDKTNPSKLASRTTIDLDKILDEADEA